MPAAAVIGGTTAYSSRQARKASDTATQAQAEAADKASDFQREAFDQLREDLSPYAKFGESSLSDLQDALGGGDINQLLSTARQERMDYDPLSNPLLARAQQERMDYNPLSNPLISQAMQEAAAYNPNQVLSPQLLENPLLQALQEDVTKRLMANQAAKGKLGSGGTAESLQRALVPQAIQFGLQLDELQRGATQNRANLGLATEGLTRQAMAGRESLGFGLDELDRYGINERQRLGLSYEDLEQREIANLMDAARMGLGAASQTGAAGTSTASSLGQLALGVGEAQAQNARNRAEANLFTAGTLADQALRFIPTAGA